MPSSRRFVCFANSRKPGGRCIAGKELGYRGRPGPWIRPVSAFAGHAIPLSWQRIDGADIHLLDFVSVAISRPDPLPRQAENHVVEPYVGFSRVGRIAWEQIDAWLDDPPHLWNVDGKTFGPHQSARVPESYSGGESLYLIRVPNLRIAVIREGQSEPKLKGEFTYRDQMYMLPITDVVIEAEYKPKGSGSFDLGPAVLCVSLGDPFHGELYKLIAAVLHDKRFA
jgi:hypothetical protein